MRTFLLLRPRFLSALNRYAEYHSRESLFIKALGRLSLLLMVGGSMGYGGFLFGTSPSPSSNQLMLNFFLIVFLSHLSISIITSIPIAFGSLFSSQEMEFILTTPLKGHHLFLGKSGEAFLSLCWLNILFVIPLCLGFTIAQDTSPLFWILTTGVIFIISAFASECSVLLCLIIGRCIPLQWGKELGSVGGLALLGALAASGGIPSSTLIKEFIESILIYVKNSPSIPFSPSSYGALALQATAQGNLLPAVGYFTALTFMVLVVAVIGSIATKKLHSAAFQRLKEIQRGIRGYDERVYFDPPPCLTKLFAIAGKEYHLFTRDIAQSSQLILLLGLSLTYISHFRSLSKTPLPQNLSYTTWGESLWLTNLGMATFLTFAICNRFVFSSPSQEGKNYWLLALSPLPMSALLWGKLVAWCLPLSVISAVFVLSGGFALELSLEHLVISTLLIFPIAFGCVGVSLGCGAWAIRLDWEHVTQVLTSFRCVMALIIYTVVALINLLVASCASPTVLRHLPSSYLQGGAILLTFLVLCTINYGATLLALSIGNRRIETLRLNEQL